MSSINPSLLIQSNNKKNFNADIYDSIAAQLIPRISSKASHTPRHRKSAINLIFRDFHRGKKSFAAYKRAAHVCCGILKLAIALDHIRVLSIRRFHFYLPYEIIQGPVCNPSESVSLLFFSLSNYTSLEINNESCCDG